MVLCSDGTCGYYSYDGIQLDGIKTIKSEGTRLTGQKSNTQSLRPSSRILRKPNVFSPSLFKWPPLFRQELETDSLTPAISFNRQPTRPLFGVRFSRHGQYDERFTADDCT